MEKNTPQEIIIIAAMAENRVIGKDNAMPWVIKEDMARFKKLTKGWPCVMGRKTWESLPVKPLPERLNVIVSRTMTADTPLHKDVKIFPSLSAGVENCSGYEKIFIIGGETVYRQALKLADKIELTVIHKQYDGDAFFPEIDTACWQLSNTEDFDTFSFLTYTKINKNKEQI
ncbi:dihydrofolate reductase [Treponema sp. R80B11-R83G3]